MFAYFVKRIFAMVPTFFGMTLVFFVILNSAPGGPVEEAVRQIRFGQAFGGAGGASGGDGGGSISSTAKETLVNEEILVALRKQYGFDKPVLFNARVEDRRIGGIDLVAAALLSANTLPETKVIQDLHERGSALVPYLVPALLDQRGSAQGLFALIHDNGLKKVRKRAAYLTGAAPAMKGEAVEVARFNSLTDEAAKLIAAAIDAPETESLDRMYQARLMLLEAAGEPVDAAGGQGPSLSSWRNPVAVPILDHLETLIGEEATASREALDAWWQESQPRYGEEYLESRVAALVGGDSFAADELVELGKVSLPALMAACTRTEGHEFARVQPIFQQVAEKRFSLEDVSDPAIAERVKTTLKRWWKEEWLNYTTIGPARRSLMFFTHARYGIWLKNIFTLEFGNSFTYERPVIEVIVSKMPVSIWFGLTSFFLSYLICIPLGVLKAVRDGTPFDYATSIALFLLYSIPAFVLGIVLIVLFGGGSYWDLIPIGGFRSDYYDQLSLVGKFLDQAKHMVAPLIAYMAAAFTGFTILMKNSVIEEIGKDYCRTARAKGVSNKKVYLKHALRNSLIPLATGIGGFLTIFFAGSMLIEKVFNLDGLGLLGFNSAIQRDYNIILGNLVIIACLGLVGRLISDFTYVLVDPRIDFAP